MFEQATSVPIDVMTGVIRAAARDGTVTRAAVAGGAADRRSRPGLGGHTRPVHHFRGVRHAFDAGAGYPACRGRIGTGAALHDGASLVVTRFGEPRPDPRARC